MNGSCKPSQLFSHWQHMHANNPAAKQLEARWRRHATPDGTEPSIVFPHSFEVGSAELREWLAGSGI